MSEMDTANKPKDQVTEIRPPTKEEIYQAKTLITRSIFELLHCHPLTFHIISQCNLKCKPGLGTFGVSIERSGCNLYYDPLMTIQWFQESPQKLQNILRHESIHLILSHLTVGFPSEAWEDPFYKILFNIALDFKVNENIPDIWNNDHKGQLYEGTCGKEALKKFLELDTAAAHNSLDLYSMLKKKGDELREKAKSLPDTLDQHGEGLSDDPADGSNPLTEEEKQAIARNKIKQAAEKLSEQQRGNLPAEIKRAIDSCYQTTLNKQRWDNLLKQFLCSIKQPKLVSTWKRPSRRYGFTSTGKKKDIKPSIAICLDTSGSMGVEALVKTLAIVKALSFRFSDIWFIAGDTQVDYCELLTKGNVNTKLINFASGGGGTTLQPLLDRALTKRVNATVMISDGYCEQLETSVKTVGLVVPGGHDIPGIEQNFQFEDFAG